MQRLNVKDEHGATAVVVGLMLVVLLGFGSLAVDAGALWWDKKQLQNGADAAALAIAQACVRDAASAECTVGENATAAEFAQLNKDSETRGSVTSLSTSAADRHVTVRTAATREPILAFVTGTEVTAEATATWSGAPSQMSTIPFAVSYCQFKWQNGGTSGMPVPGTPVAIYAKSKKNDFPDYSGGELPCADNPAHNESGGGFGFLVTKTGCETEFTNNEWVSSSPGNTFDSKCSREQILQHFGAVEGTIVKIPMFDNVRFPSGANADYQISGFAAIRVSGYCFHTVGLQLNVNKCTGDTQRIVGTFVGFGTLDDYAKSDGTATDYGVTSVKLTLN
ncbi:hypothetical protein GCM10025789_14470 [Tessaracoccus lubricantis]|uniref:Putative Flp pilus-assembly TadG-like N-terminal domain-containing protein n=1 Tax=Tessaracoccus lubricantis TaxID=545543 RepID=A0ABP9FA19_9ACTN